MNTCIMIKNKDILKENIFLTYLKKSEREQILAVCVVIKCFVNIL